MVAGGVAIGGGAPITVQSMLNVPSTDIAGSVEQALRLEQAGCQILRAAIPNKEAVALIPAIKERVSIPLVADIHFDYKLALESVAAGIDKIRINPGNIGDDSRVKAVADACRQKNIPIRIGVNSGSLEKHILANTAPHPGGPGGKRSVPRLPAGEVRLYGHRHLPEGLLGGFDRPRLRAHGPAVPVPPCTWG